MSGAKTMPFTAAGLQWKKTDYRPPPPHAELKQQRRLLDDTNLANAFEEESDGHSGVHRGRVARVSHLRRMHAYMHMVCTNYTEEGSGRTCATGDDGVTDLL
jgi:hypothetical protein